MRSVAVLKTFAKIVRGRAALSTLVECGERPHSADKLGLERTCNWRTCASKPSCPHACSSAFAASTAWPEGPMVLLTSALRSTASSGAGAASHPRRMPGATHLLSVSTRITRPSVSKCMKPGSTSVPACCGWRFALYTDQFTKSHASCA